MTIARELFDLRIGGAYLPSLLIFSLPHGHEYLLSIGAFSLLGAVYFHGLSRHVFGIGGPEENPIETEEFVERYQQVLFGGSEGDLPKTNVGVVRTLLTRASTLSKAAFIIVGIFSIIIWLPSVLISLYLGYTNFESVTIGLQFLIFAQTVWVLQWMIWRFFEEADMDGPESS